MASEDNITGVDCKVNLVDEGDLREAFADLGIDVTAYAIQEMNRFCLLYNLSAEKLAAEWYAYAAKKQKTMDNVGLTPALLEQFDENVLKVLYMVGVKASKPKPVVELKPIEKLKASSEELELLKQYGNF